MSRAAIAAVALMVALGARSARAEALQPEKTYAFLASIVKWPEGSGLATFTDERKDGALVKALEAAGVPKGNITFLADEKATRAAMRAELKALASRAGEGSTLVFYFQGHGLRHKGKTYLACYDVKDDVEQTAFGVSEIAPILEECWKGDRLVLLGDCCHSGGLASVVEHFEKSRVRAACLTSASASNRSTEHWTYTDALISALQGDGRLDRDHDGTVTFAETDRWVHDEMKYAEDQLTRGVRSSSFEATFVLRKVVSSVPDLPGEIELGDYVEALDVQKKWYLARVIGYEDGRYKVHYLGWDSKWDEVVEAARIRKATSTQLEIGGRYEVEWDHGQWFPGTVTKSEEGWFFFVHYEGEQGDDDEWVSAKHVRQPTPPEYRALAPRACKKGDAVAARWRNVWFLAKVTADGETPSVHYADNTDGRVMKEEVIPIAGASEIEDGDRVLACWDGQPRMYPGKVLKKGEKTCSILWEDGTKPTDVAVGHIARIKAP